MLQILVSFIYELVQQSWIIASIFVKYLLVAVAVKTFLEDKRSLEEFSETLIDYSPFFVLGIVLLGAANMFIGVFEEPVFKLFGEFVAFMYFLFLFWKY